jgi:hypothetical protein
VLGAAAPGQDAAVLWPRGDGASGDAPGGDLASGDLASGDLAGGDRPAGFVWTLLPRHGSRPVRFLGREVLRADNHAGGLAGGLSYWSEIRVFELHGGGYVVAVRHCGTADDVAGWQDAWRLADAGGVVGALRGHAVGAAWPQAGAPEQAQAQLRAWGALVDALFGAVAA